MDEEKEFLKLPKWYIKQLKGTPNMIERMEKFPYDSNKKVLNTDEIIVNIETVCRYGDNIREKKMIKGKNYLKWDFHPNQYGVVFCNHRADGTGEANIIKLSYGWGDDVYICDQCGRILFKKYISNI